MPEWVKQWICIQFCIKLEHSSKETIWLTQKATAMGSLWLTASSRQPARSCIMSCSEIFGKTSNHPGDSDPLEPRIDALWLLAFPKTKITFEREEIQTISEIQENMTGQLMAIGRTLWDSSMPTLKGIEASLSYVQCFLYLESSSINVSFSYYMSGYFLDRPQYVHIKF